MTSRHSVVEFGRFSNIFAVLTLALCASICSLAADSTPQIALNTSKAGPRTVEPLTERAILRDYRYAWANLTRALEISSTGPLSGLFEGNASAALVNEVHAQHKSGLSSSYLNQNHKVEAVFYSPEGDLIELHDTADYDLQIHDGDKTIYNEHVIAHYVVLMTPGADRWVVRQLQAVPAF